MLMLVAVLGAAALAGDAVVRRFAPELAGGPRAVAWSIAFTCAVLLAHEVPLALGVLSRGTVLVATAVLVVVALAAARGASRRGARDAPPAGRGPHLLGVLAVLAAAGAALAYLRLHAAEATISSDTLNFQLPQVARWIQTGSMWQLDQFFADYSNATYPHHGNVLLLAVVLPFGDTQLARLVPVVYAGFAGLAVHAGARELGARRGWALLAAATVLAVPIFVRTALDGANTDTPMVFAIAAGAFFLLRHHRTGARSDLILAGVALGLGLGTKWYALTTLPPILAVWLYARRRARAPWVADGARIVALIAAAGGIWLVRNVVETGNPIFPQWLGPLPSPRDIYREQAGATLADYLFDPGIWKAYLEPQFTRFLAAPGYVLAVAPVVAIVLARRAREWRVVAVAVAALGCLALYFVTPYSALGPDGQPVAAFASMRYAMPGLVLGAITLAWIGSRSPRLLAAGVAAAVAQGLAVEYAADLGLVFTSTAIVALLVWLARRAPRRLAVAGAVALLVLGAARVRDRAPDRPYGGYDPVLAWLRDYAPADTRIALAGVWPVGGVSPVLPAFGPELDNEVVFAGHFVDGMMRAEADQASFARRLRGFDAVLVGRGLVAPAPPAPEEAWAQAAGFRPEVESPGLALLLLGE